MAQPVPMRMIARVEGLTYDEGRKMAQRAAGIARRAAPKLSGQAAKRIDPIHGIGWFGVAWQDPYLWYQEMGIKAFTMKNLSGKTIPMWIDDPTGTEREKNPKAKTRVMSGRTQVLIFRKVGTKGDTKRKKDKDGNWSTIPNLNYPGGAGRIALRSAAKPFTAAGKMGGQIAPGNVGVRWRHPGISARHFLLHGIKTAASEYRVIPDSIVAVEETGHQTPIA